MATRKTTTPSLTAKKQQSLQRKVDAKDRKDAKDTGKAKPPKPPEKTPVQAGRRRQPQNPMPAQHLAKPGNEHELELAPRFLAPGYKGSGKLKGMAAIVTGGDSGIGRAVAVLFAREGADVAVLYLDEHKDARDTKKCVQAEGRECVIIAGDVRDTKFCESAVKKVVKAFGRLDVLVNNAAFQMHAARLEDIDDERIDLTLQTNIGGYMRMARAALPHLKEGGSIVNTGSRTGLQGSRNLIDYSATKGAIHAFTKALALNVIDRGIRVNAVAPGPVWTPLNPADKKAADVKKFGKETDFKRVAQPEELSPAYVFLASPVCAGYVTGIVLPVTGSVAAI
jgi:NAD(P)-dependent dehydrogenase (short-subunit alcohol dehydrogenase family)